MSGGLDRPFNPPRTGGQRLRWRLARQQLFDGEHKSGEGGGARIAVPIALGRHLNAEFLRNFHKIANKAEVPSTRRWTVPRVMSSGKTCRNAGQSEFQLVNRNQDSTHDIKLQ